MVIRGSILKSAPNSNYFGYSNSKIRRRRLKPELETHKPEIREYPPQTRPAAILKWVMGLGSGVHVSESYACLHAYKGLLISCVSN